MKLSVGHYTHSTKGTGLSVFLFEHPATAAYYICGSSVASRELHLLELDSNSPNIDGLLLTGGSAFGLGAADGVMQWLKEKGQGKMMPHGGVVPMVPSAAIYDLALLSPEFPTSDDAYKACQSAKLHNTDQGRIGAGTGATVGKIVPNAKRMTGGIGHASMQLDNGLEVSAYVVVNAVGDIYDQHGKIIAGAIFENGTFANCDAYLLSGHAEKYLPKENTTLVAVFTNASFNKIELRRISKMITTGMAKAISPVFTRYDGDLVFCISLGEIKASELMVGAIAAEATRRAIVNAVQDSKIIEERDLQS